MLVLSLGLENSIHPVLQSSTLFALNVLLGCTRLVLSCGAGPYILLLALPVLACNQLWLVLSGQGGAPLRSFEVTMWVEQDDFPLAGCDLFTIILSADSWQRQLCCPELRLPRALRQEEGRGAGGRRGRSTAARSAAPASVFISAKGLCYFCASFNLWWGERAITDSMWPSTFNYLTVTVFYLLFVTSPHHSRPWTLM